MKVLMLMLAAALVSAVVPVQSILNGRLGQAVANPFLAGLISFVGGTAFLLIATLAWSGGIPRWPTETPLPWYLFTGGLWGALFVVAILVLVPKIGAANVITATIVGQLVMSLLIDHWGWLGVPRNALTLGKLAGVALLAGGAWMIKNR